jgi:hypothetical protein
LVGSWPHIGWPIKFGELVRAHPRVELGQFVPVYGFVRREPAAQFAVGFWQLVGKGWWGLEKWFGRLDGRELLF